jgi:CTP synthase
MQSIDAESIYDIPLLMQQEGLDREVLNLTHMPIAKEPELNYWKEFLRKLKFPKSTLTIGLIGKYVELHDAYKSISESFIHGGVANECKVNLEYIHSEEIDENNIEEKIKHLHGILVAPGFGERGIEGKITAISYARTHNIPFLGICLGMQCAVVEFARNVLEYKDAHSTEMNPMTKHPVIDLMEEQKKISGIGGTMRLGAYPCELKQDSLAHEIYNQTHIVERHRHRYEFNNIYLNEFESHGMKATGINRNQNLVEIIEIPTHPFFIGVQFHPEYKSTVERHHPLFEYFVKAAKDYKTNAKK